MSSVGRSLWRPSSSPPQLAAEELHLWRFHLETSSLDLIPLKKLLSSDEEERAARLLDPRKSQDLMVCRARTRQILASYLAVEPAQIAFAYGRHGKPTLQAPVTTDLTFNLTHSGAWALLVVARGMEVGIDLEKIDADLDYEPLVACVFTPEENSDLAIVPELRRRRMFYRLWTKKEARLKGTGRGFSVAEDAAQAGWTTRPFWLGRGYVGTVACAAAVATIRRFQWVTSSFE